MPKPQPMHPSALHAKTTTDAPKCFTCQNHNRCAQVLLHAKTTTDAPKCFTCQNHNRCAQVLYMPKPPWMWPGAIVPSSKRFGGGLTKRQGKGGEGGGDWGVWYGNGVEVYSSSI